MRKIIATFAALAALSTSVPAFAQDYGYRTLQSMDALHQSLFGKSVTDGVIDRSLEPRVDMVHTDHGSVPKIRFVASYQANMCVLEKMHCTVIRLWNGKSSMECNQFTPSFTAGTCNVGTTPDIIK